MKKKIIFITVLILVIAGAFWAKAYYNDRYVVLDSFYTQIPSDEVNEDSWLVDKDGVKQKKVRNIILLDITKMANKEKFTLR